MQHPVKFKGTPRDQISDLAHITWVRLAKILMLINFRVCLRIKHNSIVSKNTTFLDSGNKKHIKSTAHKKTATRKHIITTQESNITTLLIISIERWHTMDTTAPQDTQVHDKKRQYKKKKHLKQTKMMFSNQDVIHPMHGKQLSTRAV
ncbi:hypothetical protein ACJX0J_032152, partial [Zea mays]